MGFLDSYWNSLGNKTCLVSITLAVVNLKFVGEILCWLIVDAYCWNISVTAAIFFCCSVNSMLVVGLIILAVLAIFGLRCSFFGHAINE